MISVSVSASVRDHMHISGTRRPIFVECMLSVDVATSTVAALRYVTSFRFISHRNPNSRMTVFMHFYVVSETHFFSISASDSTKNASKSKQIHYLANDLKPCNATETEVGKPASQD